MSHYIILVLYIFSWATLCGDSSFSKESLTRVRDDLTINGTVLRTTHLEIRVPRASLIQVIKKSIDVKPAIN